MGKGAKYSLWACMALALGYGIYRYVKTINPNPEHEVGQALDSLNGVVVYYNGGIDHVSERNTSADGYNIGLKYQCVEFVKRYYYEYYHHQMPDSYGNAKDFFGAGIPDGGLNKQRGLLQFKNPSRSRPQVGDLLIMDGHSGNPYGHVAIVSQVAEGTVQIIQQNPGPFAGSRVAFPLDSMAQGFSIGHERVLGWLRKEL